MPFWSPARPAAMVPSGGACRLCRLPILPLACFLAPIPHPPLPSGKGGFLVFFMQGASPLASPRLNPGGTCSTCRCGKLNGGLASAALTEPAKQVPGGGAQGGGRPPTLPLRCSQGGLPSLPPAYPAFSLFVCPHPPTPLPSGKGEIFSFFMQGASPLASPGLGGARHWIGKW